MLKYVRLRGDKHWHLIRTITPDWIVPMNGPRVLFPPKQTWCGTRWSRGVTRAQIRENPSTGHPLCDECLTSSATFRLTGKTPEQLPEDVQGEAREAQIQEFGASDLPLPESGSW